MFSVRLRLIAYVLFKQVSGFKVLIGDLIQFVY
jgi:hypothetical protein